MPLNAKNKNLKEILLSFFYSKINIGVFSDLIKKYRWLSPPFKLFAQKSIDFDFPRHTVIEVTSLCNLRCKMCPRKSTPIKLGSMNFDLFKKIIDEAKQYKERAFSLHLSGDPLLDPEVAKKMAYIKEVNPKNSIILTTNGILLTNEISQALVKSKVDKITVSIHSHNPSTYKEITGYDRLETVEKNIKELIKIKKEARAEKPRIYLRVIRIKENFKETEDFRKKWKNEPVIVEIRDEHNYGGNIKDNFLKPTPAKRYPCYHLWLSPAINWDGEVTICCNDIDRKAIVGNVKNSSLSEIWKSDILKRYREHHLKGEYHKVPLCKNCDVWDLYPDIFFERQKIKNKNEKIS